MPRARKPQNIATTAARGKARRPATTDRAGKAKCGGLQAGDQIQRRSRGKLNLLRAQFPDEKTWNGALAGAGLTRRALQREAETNLRDRNWLEAQIAARIRPNDAEVPAVLRRTSFGFSGIIATSRQPSFSRRARGVIPAEVIAAKRSLSEQLSKRLAGRGSFSALVAEFSEDDATKKRGGDLGYFALSERMLPAVFDAAQKLHRGETSAPIRSRLGFHIIQLTERRPARALTFEEARPEIEALLANQKRAGAVATTVAALR